MKVLIIVDTLVWAIGHLAEAKKRYSPHHNIKIIEAHPRDCGEKDTQDRVMQEVNDFKPDIVHYEFYRTCHQLMEALPELKKYKSILTHHNQRTKALRFANWKELGIDHLVTHTNKCKEYLVEECFQSEEMITVIKHGIDLDYFEYSDEEPEEKYVGYAGRICPWKGLKEIAEVSKELDYPVMFMGKHDKPAYWNEISEEAKANINFSFMECSDKERINYYRSLTCYVGFSKDGYEEGTLEYLEAMACGVPVITTPNGSARDLGRDGENCLMVDFEDREGLKKAIHSVMESPELRKRLREKGWETVKNMTEQKMSYEYSKLYNKINSEEKLVSVIIPTTLDRKDLIYQIFDSLEKQNYKNFEVVLAVDEGKEKIDEYKEIVKELRGKHIFAIKSVFTDNTGYGLAQARNMAVIESEGDILVFLDSRLKPEEDAINVFKMNVENDMYDGVKSWFFGDKGAQKKSFVENFSAVSRRDFINFGMFNERIDAYGGMSQEIRTRWVNQGGSFKYLDDAVCEQIKGSKKTAQRRKDIIKMKYKLLQMYKGNNH